MEANLPQQSENDIDPQKLKSVRELLLQFVKTAKTVRLYLANNPMRQKFLSDLYERFELYLRAYGALRLKVRQHAFVVDGEVVYEQEGRQDNLAFRCYVDGITELTFHEGLEQGELVELLEVIGSDQDPNALDDDLVSLLWKRDLPHITTVVVDELPEHADSVPDQVELKVPDLKTMVRQEVETLPSSALEGPKRLEHPMIIFKLTDEEIQQLKQQIAKEQQRDAVAQLLDILTVMLEIELDETSFGEILEILEKMVDLFLERGDLYRAASCATKVRQLYDHPPQQAEAFRTSLHQFLVRLGAPERLDKLAAVLNKEKEVDAPSLTAFIQTMTPQALGPLSDLLGTVVVMKTRKVICDAMVPLGQDHLEVLAGRLKDDRWFVVRNLIYVMGRIGGAKVITYLAPLVRHPEPRVRKEIIKILDGMDSEKVIDVLLECLPDQESSVRMMAMRALARRKTPRVIEPLTAIIEDRQFAAKDVAEKLDAFVTLGSSGRPEALAVLKQFLKGSSWWRRSEHEQSCWCAAYALKQMGTDEAIALLEEGSQHASRGVQEACLAALRGTARELVIRQAR
ncbi:MAG TPA: HEAT repeat domain-containing protein [Nitrospiria bacterium]|nr:HEAT repeat domain-containing protein [Nitrospiria bacterium]